jgi:hypothetical protein
MSLFRLGSLYGQSAPCGGHPSADVFVKYYELHYHQKKIRLEGSKNTLGAQFGYIMFHPSRYGGGAKLTLS